MISKIDVSTQNFSLYRSVWCKNLVSWSSHQNLDSPENPKSDFNFFLSLQATSCIFVITSMISITGTSKENLRFYWRCHLKVRCFWSFRRNPRCLNNYTNARISDLSLLSNWVFPTITGMVSIKNVSLDFLHFWKNLQLDILLVWALQKKSVNPRKCNVANSSDFSVIKLMFLRNHKFDFSHQGLEGVFRNCRGVRIPFKSEWT